MRWNVNWYLLHEFSLANKMMVTTIRKHITVFKIFGLLIASVLLSKSKGCMTRNRISRRNVCFGLVFSYLSSLRQVPRSQPCVNFFVINLADQFSASKISTMNNALSMLVGESVLHREIIIIGDSENLIGASWPIFDGFLTLFGLVDGTLSVGWN